MEQWTDAHGANAVKRPNRRVRDPYARAVWEGNPDSLRVGATYPIYPDDALYIIYRILSTALKALGHNALFLSPVLFYRDRRGR